MAGYLHYRAIKMSSSRPKSMSGLTGSTSAPYRKHLSHAGLAEFQRIRRSDIPSEVHRNCISFEAYFRRI